MEGQGMAAGCAGGTGLSRRRLLSGAAGMAIPLLASPLLATPRLARAEAPVRARDLLGREVALPRPARRVVLGQGRHLAVLNLLHPDPASLVVAWSEDMRRGEAREYAKYRQRFPALDQLPNLGQNLGGASLEMILAARPDLVLLSRRNLMALGEAGAQGLLRSLETAGIPATVIDFFIAPLRDTEPSLETLGTLIGREAQAQALLAFHRGRMQAVRTVLAGAASRPSVFMHVHAGGTDCCYSPGRGVFDDLIQAAGGRNIGAETLPAETGQLNLEAVLARNPDVYVATGGPFGGRGGVSLGVGVEAAAARASLEEVIRRQNLGSLPAVQGGRAYALWHGFNDSPTHVIAVEAMARWFHPQAAAALDPAASQAVLNERFATVPMEGTYWTDMA